jgi:hypothetical protein
MSLPEIIRITNRQKIGAIAERLLGGKIGIIEASRQIASLRHGAGIGNGDPDVLLFVGVDSETDHLPIGAGREHWAADALAAKDAEIARAEAFYRKRVLEVCPRLVARYAQEKIPEGAYDHYNPNT